MLAGIKKAGAFLIAVKSIVTTIYAMAVVLVGATWWTATSGRQYALDLVREATAPQFERLEGRIAALEGPPDIIEMSSGRAYSPCYNIAPCVIEMRARRTEYGLHCSVRRGEAVVVDAAGLTIPGKILSTPVELSDEFETLRVRVEFSGVRPGDATAEIRVFYTCPDNSRARQVLEFPVIFAQEASP